MQQSHDHPVDTPLHPPSIASASAETVALRGAMAVIGFVSTVLVSRALGPAGRGDYYLAVVAAATLQTFAKLGLEQANVFLLAERQITPQRLAAQNGLVSVVIGTSCALLLLTAPVLLPSVFGDIPLVVLLLAALTIPFALHTELTAGLQTLLGRVTWQFRVAVASGAVRVLLLVALVLRGGVDVVAALSANLVAALCGWLGVLRGNPWRGPAVRWDPVLLRQSLRSSLPLHVAMLLLFLHLRLDVFLLQALSGAEAVGVYSVAVALAETMLIATDSMAIAILPRQVRGAAPLAAELALRGARLAILIGVVVGAGWVVVGQVVLSVFFGNPFAAAYAPLVTLLPGLICLSVQRLSGAVVLRTGRPFLFASIYAVSLALNVLLNLLWIPHWQALGAAAASSVSYAAGALLFIFWTARVAKAPFVASIVPRRADVAALTDGVRRILGRAQTQEERR